MPVPAAISSWPLHIPACANKHLCIFACECMLEQFEMDSGTFMVSLGCWCVHVNPEQRRPRKEDCKSRPSWVIQGDLRVFDSKNKTFILLRQVFVNNDHGPARLLH